MGKQIPIDQNFIGVDLHVHTPASSCYKGEKIDKEYLEILKRYAEKDIKIIAITDHNTLKGYKKILSIKEELYNKKKVLEEYKDEVPDLQKKFDEINDDIDLFEKVMLLPGVEFEAKPGIHLLLIFNPNSDLDKIEDFLISAGYIEEQQGMEDPDIISRYGVDEVLDIVGNIGGTIIAAHADSNKGIYNELKGSFRASIFRSDNLSAISYKSHKTLLRMKQLLHNTEYKREKPLAFIQSSDYHGGDDIPGSSITFLKLNERSYEEIITAFKNPNEQISATQHPEILNIIEEISNDPKTFTFNSFDTEEDKHNIRDTACAILNQGYGNLVFGVNLQPEFNIIGIDKTNDEFDNLLDSIMSDIYPGYNFDINKYPFGEKNVVVVKLSSASRSIYFVNDETFLIKGKSIIKAKPKDIEEYVEQKIFNRMIEYQKINKSKIENLINELNLLKEDTKRFVLINNIEKNSLMISDICSIELVRPYKNKFEPENEYGVSDGNVFFTTRTEPHFPYAYLRCLPPITGKYNIEDLSIDKYSGSAIIVVPGGGTHIIESNKDWGVVSLDESDATLILKIKEDLRESFSEKAILAWMKSSVLLWYSSTLFEDTNIHEPKIFMKIPVPILDIFKPNNVLDNVVSNILELEHEFLSNLYPIGSIKETQEKIVLHNKRVEKIAHVIDKIILNSLNVSMEETKLVYKFLESIPVLNILSKNPIIENMKANKEIASTIEED